MLRNGLHYCDLCQREIATGERYVVRRIDRSEIPQGFAAAKMKPDGSAQIQFDICRDCQTRMGLSGEVTVD